MAEAKKIAKTLPEVISKATAIVFHDDDFAKAYPVMFSLLRAVWTDGVCTFEPCTIGLTMKGSTLYARIHSATAKMEVSVPLSSPMLLWDELEAAMGKTGVAWEPDYKTKERSRQKLEDSVS